VNASKKGAVSRSNCAHSHDKVLSYGNFS